MKLHNKNVGFGLLSIAFLAVIVAFFFVEPVAQNLDYHLFSDTRGFAYFPNALNVLSNIPFIVIGIFGLMALNNDQLTVSATNKLPYVFLFLGTALVGVGSGYYHLTPNNETLVWDRMPMTIAFMSLYAIVISEFVSEKLGRRLLFPLIAIGIASVIYWWLTEMRGEGDLRFYAAVQFLPILTIPILLMFFHTNYDRINGYWLLIFSYVAAKVVETLDYQLHELLTIISGHSIKHVLPALGLYFLIITYRKRVAT